MSCDVTTAIVLSGGLGKRLRPVIGNVPKGLALIKGRPILTYVLDRLDAQGVTHAILAVGFQAGLLSRTIGTTWGRVRIEYSAEDQPRGTGGALRLAATRLAGAQSFVLNGDTYLDVDLQDFARSSAASNATAGVALAWVADGVRYHKAHCRANRICSLAAGQPGPARVNTGTYWLTASALAALPECTRFSFEDDFLTAYVEREHVHAYFRTRNFVDIGTPEDYLRCQTDDRF